MNQDDIYDAGVELYEAGKYNEAILLLRQGMSMHPDDTDLIVLLSACYNELHHFTASAKLLLRANTIKPNDPVIVYNLGYSFLCMGRVEEGVENVKRCLELKPPAAIKRMANNMLKSEEDFRKLNKEANVPLEEEFKCQQKFLEAQRHLYSHDLDKAMALYREILAVKPNHAASLSNIGLCYMKKGKLKKAIPYFEKAAELDSADVISLGNLAYVYHILGDFETSQKYAKQITDRKLQNRTLRDASRLASIFIDIGDFTSARKVIDQSGQHRNNAQLIFLSGVIYARQKNYSAALKEFGLIQEDSEEAEKYFQKAIALKHGKIKNYRFEPKVIQWGFEMF